MDPKPFSDTLTRLAIGAVLALVVMILLGAGCKPVLDELDPPNGPPGTAVEVKGGNLFLATVRWDANTPEEQTLPSDFLGARFFTVPLDAQVEPHPVRLHGDGQYSDNRVEFEVTAGTVRPQPRLDDVTVAAFEIDSEGRASMVLMAHGANIDVGAKIIVDGTERQSYFSRLLRNGNMYATKPSTLEYPIFHYATLWCFLKDVEPGTNVSVLVKNLDGETSKEQKYHVAANMEELDSDGDGLLDVWETRGYDSDGNGSADVDLPALGANPLHKDLFVEVDWMCDCAPDPGIWGKIKAIFADAPIMNSDGSPGISIHIDCGRDPGDKGGDVIRFPCAGGPPSSHCQKLIAYGETDDPDIVAFHKLKEEYFDPLRLKIFRYCIFSYKSAYGNHDASGMAESILCNDFFISLGGWGDDGRRPEFQIGTFIHELGHTLGLWHGGNEDVLSKDNYNSVMQYGNDPDETYYVESWPPCSPSQLGGIDVDCDLTNFSGVYTYSQGQRCKLDEKHLDELLGVCDDVHVDWDADGLSQEEGDPDSETDVSVNLDDRQQKSTIEDYADWANIELNFLAAGSNWNED